MSNSEIDLIVAAINGEVQVEAHAEVERNLFDRDQVSARHMPDLDGKSALLGYLDAALILAKETGSPCALSLVKLANHNDILTFYGPAGVLDVETLAAQRLRQTLRLGDNCVNLGQGTFAILFQNCHAEELKVAALRLSKVLTDGTIECAGGFAQMHVHVGGVSSVLGSHQAEEFLQFAEMALSRADGAVRHVYVLNDPERLQDYYSSNARHVSETIAQLQQNKLFLRLDPIVGSDHGQPKRFLATLALPRPPLEERLGHFSGLDSALDLRSIELALQSLGAEDDLQLELHLSGLHIFDAKWQAQFFPLLESAPELCQRLVLSVSESLMQGNLSGLSILFARLQGLGCQLGLFACSGTATGFAMAQSLAIQQVSFVASDVPFDTVLTAQMALAQENGWRCVMTDVNSQAQADRFATLGFVGMTGSLWVGEVKKPDASEPTEITFSDEFEASLAQLRAVLLNVAVVPEQSENIAA